jgi:hypothetical protein
MHRRRLALWAVAHVQDFRPNRRLSSHRERHGAGGIRKRIAGWKKEHGDGVPATLPFYLVTVAPNLGTGDADLKELIASIEAVGVTPCAIALDTLAQSLGGADENSTGMASFVTNATAMANHFGCFVAADDKRLRGNTTLIGGLNVAILAEREEGALAAVLTVKKLKDEEDGQKITVRLVRVSIGVDEDGEDISTLVVQSVDPGAPKRGHASQSREVCKYLLPWFSKRSSSPKSRQSGRLPMAR